MSPPKSLAGSDTGVHLRPGRYYFSVYPLVANAALGLRQPEAHVAQRVATENPAAG